MIVEIGYIYYLQNPITDEIFYVGSTQISLKNRLRSHYQHLREFERGLRKSNKRYEYLQQLRPYKATIHLLELVQNGDLDEREVHHIKLLRKINPNLTNMTDGGRGNHTSKYYTEQQLEEYSKKISVANKGKAKPTGFAENLSVARKGLGNPATRELNNWIVCAHENKPIRMFKYGFEINDFVDSNSAYGNVYKRIRDLYKTRYAYGFDWWKFSECRKDIQDIVQSQYENTSK